ncbi:MAG TPA: sigma-70 family RNA polymerase sigma factor [Gaiellaceae bacterium]|nr:sigma-70 family RNA polymerase sigma factor [Gaiellaceae bacterium]
MTPLLAREPRVDRSFERLYRRHATDVYRYAFGVLRNEADAEDVTQTTFLNAYRALERGEQPRVALNWLITIAHNVCRQRFRAASRRPQEVELDFDVADALVADDAGGPTPEDIRRALGYLAFNQRAALVMRELEGRSYAEIAEVLGLTTAAVETLIFRARRALREQLEGALTCDEAELAISKQLDSQLSRAEKSQLRAHLRECPECATLARRERAQRKALKAFGLVPLPSSLAGLFGGGGATIGLSLAAKTAAVVVVAGAVGAGGYDIHHALQSPRHAGRPAAVPVAVVIEPPHPVVVVREEHLGRSKPIHVSKAHARPLPVEAAPAAVAHAPKIVPAARRAEKALKPGKSAAKRPKKKAVQEPASFSQGRHLHP